MSEIGGMPRRVLVYSAIFHLAVAGTLYGLYHFHLFDRDLVEDTPLVVQLVNAAPQTRATEVNRTPPKPEKPPEVAEAEPPKPEPPKPEAPKPEPPPPEPAPKPPPPPPPEPKPELKAEAPKPPPRKPEPPKKKEDDAAFDTLLKNLAKRDPARLQDQQQATAVPRASSQPIAPLGPQLTTSELDLVKQQIARCWNVPAGARDAKDLRPEFRVYMNPDATVRSATQLNPERNSDPFFRAAAESAMRALRNPQCQPLKLPPQKYDLWQTFTITFDPKDLL